MTKFKRMFYGKEIVINNITIDFQDDIYGLEILEDKILVLLDTGKFHRKANNVYCYGNNGELLWKMKSHENSTSSIKDIKFGYDENKLIATDYNEQEYMVNIETGELLIEVDK